MSQLAQAHSAARLRGTLADALRSPILARCLEITAEALARPRVDHYRPPAAAPPVPAVSQPELLNRPRRDFKRASAADIEE